MPKLKTYLIGIIIPVLLLGIIAFFALYANYKAVGAPAVFISTPATTSPTALQNFSFTIGTTTPQGPFGSSTLAVYGSTTIQTWRNTIHAFEVFDSATSTVFRVDTINRRASTSAFVISNLLSCDTIDTDANGILSCGTDSGGGSAPFPVTTIGGTVHAASSTLPFYFGQGLLTSSSTIGTLTAGALTATSSILSSGHLSASSSISVAASSTFSSLINVGTSGEATSTFNSGILSKLSIESLGGLKSGSLTITGLTSALLLANSAGNIGEYAGGSCTNQLVRSIDAAGAPTCATVVAGDVSLANLTATDGTLTFSGAYNGSTARTIGLNLGQANIWTALQQFTSGLTAASSTFLGNLQIQSLFASSSAIINGSSTIQNVLNVGGVDGTASSTFNTGIKIKSGCYETATSSCLTNTASFTFAIASSTMSTSTRARQFRVPVDFDITKVSCVTYGASAAIQLDERVATTPQTAGTNILSAALTCTTSGAATQTFTNRFITQDNFVNLQITDAQPAAARPTILEVHIYGEKVQ